MAERTNSSKWYWLPPLLLMIFPALVLIAWWRWTQPMTAVEKPSPPPPIATSPQTIAEPIVAEEPALPSRPLAAAPSAPRIDRGTTTKLEERASPPKKHPARGDVSDAALADFDPETIAMLNRHKYWSVEKQGLVDGLYDQWLNAMQQGAEAEDVRQQIAWALEGRFMEKY